MDYLETYAQLTTGQLLRLAREQDALTDDARRALEAELQRRGISAEQELAPEAAAPGTEDQAEPEALRREAWWKSDVWTRMLIWIAMAAVFAALALLVTGERDLGVALDMTSQFVLVAVLGCAASQALPERWRTVRATFLTAATVLLVWSAVWAGRRF